MKHSFRYGFAKEGKPAVQSQKYTLFHLTKAELNDIILALNLLLDNNVTIYRDADLRIAHLRNRLQKLNQ
jgi:hypothetical protein